MKIWNNWARLKKPMAFPKVWTLNSGLMARQYVTDSGDLTHIPLYIVHCIDWEMVGQDLMHDFVEHNGFYFTNY